VRKRSDLFAEISRSTTRDQNRIRGRAATTQGRKFLFSPRREKVEPLPEKIKREERRFRDSERGNKKNFFGEFRGRVTRSSAG